ncbi:hypothetical protein, partial [Caulobacter sp. 17J65-9]|uniref:hypothetical protein n=1 Tax=Caulobacter sp. 17J65-9 TaxID=2709382 RepID=UPI0013CC535E
LWLGAAGTVGGGAAGVVGGLLYGVVGASQSTSGPGAVSVALVLVCLTAVVAVLGGAGVGFGIAAASMAPGRLSPWSVLGGAIGGLLVGAVVKLLGLDAFNLLFGHAPGDITGAPEGALLGAAVGLGAWLSDKIAEARSVRRGVAVAGLCGALAGLLIPMLGGRMMGGSLQLVAQGFPDSRLRLDPFGALVGESGFGPVSQALTGALEGLLFGACLVGAMVLVRRLLTPSPLAASGT